MGYPHEIEFVVWSEHFALSNILGFHAEQALLCHRTHISTDDGSG